MTTYRAPIADFSYLFNDVFAMQQHYQSVPGGDQATPDMLDAIFTEAGKFCENELVPLYQSGDEGCIWNDGEVTTPAGFKEAYQNYIAGGWTSLNGEEKYGGQNLPPSVSIALTEMVGASNWAFGMYPGLTEGAIATIESHGTEAQKDTYLPNMLAGTWSGTMCLTEPQCGTDLSQVKTKADPNEDGSYKITGTKIFISAGEHDLTENIIHVVLARLPDAPKGTKGISLFLVPKFVLDEQGGIGGRNGVRCGSLEHKMGIHGNATAVLNFDEATGYLIGEPNEGLAAMFTYMNVARLGTAQQGVALTELSYQNSLNYARERLAMRSLSGTKNPNGPADAIIVHPDVRRMLLTQRAIAEGGRAMILYASRFADLYRSGSTEQVREDADQRLGFCTPILKAFLTELGFNGVNLGLQVFGGHGFIKEWGMEQIVRDARIATLYEGTTGVQALDLVGRKLLMDKFRQLNVFTGEILAFARTAVVGGEQGKLSLKRAATLTKLALQWRYLALRIGMRAKKNADYAGAGSVDFLMFSGYVYMAYMWAKMEVVSTQKLAANEGDADFHRGKIQTAQFYFERMLPQAKAHSKALSASLESLMKISEEQLMIR